MTASWTILAVGLATGVATLAGGGLALRLRSILGLLLAFSSGTIIGVALFDLLPEAMNLAGEGRTYLRITTATATGFALYLIAQRLSVITSNQSVGHRHFGPASLTIHSLLDGIGIGLAFHVSTGAGIIVALGVLAHDCIDGANTVALSMASGSGNKTARLWLAADALAPILGILLARQIEVPASTLALLLGVFAGFFLYIGASQLLPRSEALRPQLSTTATTLFGLATIYCLVRLANS